MAVDRLALGPIPAPADRYDRQNEAAFRRTVSELAQQIDALLARTFGITPLRIGDYYLWVDATGDLRIKATEPTSDTDGTVVGSQIT